LLLFLFSPLKLQEERNMRARNLLVLISLLGVMAIAPGCSTGETTTRTTQTTVNADQESPPPQPTTTTTTTTSESDSVLGATFHLVGTIIMLPFRVIGLIV
jgi:hypothetical protein